MIECPACASNRVPAGATHCNSCGYAIDKPVEKERSEGFAAFAHPTGILSQFTGPKGRFIARSIASALILYGILLSAYFLLFASIFSIPIGIGSLPAKGSTILLSAIFNIISVIALVQCWRQNLFKPLTVFTALISLSVLIWQLAAGTDRVEMHSVPTPATDQYSRSARTIELRPTDIEISIPSNQLWYVHTNEISRGYPQNEPFVGKPWDRAELRLLLPNLEPRSAQNNAAFHQHGGENLFILMFMMPQGFDGDPRRQWKSINLIPSDAEQAKLMEMLRQDERVQPSKLIRRHEELGLDEYDGKDEFGSRYFKQDDFVMRCWSPPFSTIKNLCESSFDLPNGLLVNFQFPRTYLSEWQKLRKSAEATANSFPWQKKKPKASWPW